MASNQYNPRRQQPAAAKKKKRSGASSNSGRPQVPGWVWLAAGVAVGVFVSFLVKLAGMPAGSTTTVALDGNKAAKSATLETGAAAKGAAGKNAAGKNAEQGAAKAGEERGDKSSEKAAGDAAKPATKFDFYTLLPEREVIVPNEREAIKPATDKPKAAPAETEEPLFLQVGSFRAAQEADRRRAQVILLGLEAKVESVQANGDTWYRVQAGPFTSREKLSKARSQLSAEGIESLQLKQKPQG
jgi:cell division protein FtsN